MCEIRVSCLPVVGPSDIAPIMRSQGNQLLLATKRARLDIFHIERVRNEQIVPTMSYVGSRTEARRRVW
jgi:hypothetical protein